MIVSLAAFCGGLALLVNVSQLKGGEQDSSGTGADSVTTVAGPAIAAITFLTPESDIDSLSWWPPGLEDALRRVPLVLEARERGLKCSVNGEFAPSLPGIVWHGLPLEWPLEMGGDISITAGAACSELRVSHFSPWLGSGQGTIRFEPWESVVTSPVTSVQVLRGDCNDRSYAVGLSTGVTSSVFSLISIALSKGDGARTNADYSRTQYDVRFDLRPPVLGACRVTAHRGRVERGDPGPDPRLWSASMDDPLNPSYWAVSHGYGAPDAMWADDRETITRDLLALQLERVLRDRPVAAALVEEDLEVNRQSSVPLLDGAPALRVANGDLASRRRALLTRMPLMAAAEESLWAGLSLEQVTRDVNVAWTADDSVWNETIEESLERGRLALGMGLPGVHATLTTTSSDIGTDLSWGLVAQRELPGFWLEAGVSGGSDERRLDDLWRGLLTDDDPPQRQGRMGIAWMMVSRESAIGDLSVGGMTGWGSDMWGWCESESLPPGSLRRWGPASTKAMGVTASWRASPAAGVEIKAGVDAIPWKVGDAPVPRWPKILGRGRLTLRHALGRAATPRLDILARHAGQRFAGTGGTLPLDSYWQFDGQAGVEIGDFTVLVVVENFTGARHEEERGYPVDGLRFRAGFTWLFWD